MKLTQESLDSVEALASELESQATYASETEFEQEYSCFGCGNSCENGCSNSCSTSCGGEYL